MAVENKITVSLASKDTAKVSLSLSDDSGNIVASATDISPVIKFITTGPAGPPGDNAIINDNAITSAKIANGAVTGAKLSSGAVTVTKINNSAVSTAKIQNSAVTTDKIANQSVTINKLALNSVGPEQIIDGTVTTELLNDGAITANKYGDLSIDTAKLKDGVVTSIKLDSNLSLDGTTTVKKLIGLGESPFTITGPVTDNFELISKQDLIFQVDADQSLADGTHSFIWKNGDGTQIAALDESGNLTISGTVDGIDISTLQNLYPTADATKVGFLTVTQAVNLDTLESNVATNNAKNTYPSADATKVGFLQVTQNVNLDLIETSLSGVIDKTQHISISQPVDLDAMETKLAGIASGAEVNYTLIDSDTMSGASSTNVASAESIKTYVDAEVAGIVDSAPGTLNTLNELAAALGDDANFSTTVTNNIATKQPILSEGAFADGDKTKLDGIATGATASPDLTVDGAGTVHANNVPTLNQNTTGNAATATALTSGNKIIQGELEVQGNLLFSTTDGDPQHIRDAQDTDVITITDGGLTTLLAAGNLDIGSHDFRAESFTSDAATGQPPFTVSSTTEVANLRAATASALASGDQTINGNLAVTGTVDGIDIATDVAANTAKTSFPGFGTTAGTALEGDTTIPTQYTDADAVSAVAAADDYLKNDTNEVLAGSLEINSQLFINKPDGTSKTRFRNIATTSNKTLDVPDESGTIMLRGNAHQVMQVSLRDHVDYMFYMFNHNYWYSAGASTLAILGNSASPSNITAANSEYQSRVAAYTAVENCILQKMVLNFYWSSSAISGDADLEFAFSKFTPIQDGTAAIITINDITATDCDDAYTEAKPYQKTFEFSGNNATLSAGDAFGFHMRTINSQNSQRVLVYASAVLQIRLT